jgi:hypothetical protein
VGRSEAGRALERYNGLVKGDVEGVILGLMELKPKREEVKVQRIS